MNPAIWLERAARRWPARTALLRGATPVATYGELAGRAASIARFLAERHNIRTGDRVALFMGNAPEYLELLYAAWWAGAAVVPINAKLHEREAAWIVANSGARLVFADAAHGETLAPLLDDETVVLMSTDTGTQDRTGTLQPSSPPATMARDDLCWLFYTSGTTGKPKGVMITAGNVHAMAHSYFVDVDEVREDDAILYAAPMSHGAGLYNFMHVMRGARHVVPDSGGFDPAEIRSLAESVGSISMFAAPTMVRRLVDFAKASGWSGEGIRTIVYGGGPMYLADICDAIDTMGPRFVQIYGQGESPMTITALPRALVSDRGHPRWRERLASVGLAQSCVEVRIGDGQGNTLPAGSPGEVMVRGAAVMGGYWRNEAATAAAIRDGWLATGDVGAMDADGYLTLLDRSKDLIISGGTNIYPREVEEALLEHPGVHEVSVIGRPHAEWGEEVMAFVVAGPGQSPSPADLDRHCLDRIARFKRPKHYRFVAALPKNNYGKVLKTELRRLAEDPANVPDPAAG